MQSQLAEDMFAATRSGITPRECQAPEHFRTRFQHALGSCLQKGFLLEESFALVWEEALEEIVLSQAEQRDLRQELLEWAEAQINPA
jgi:hypothetical protein